MHNIYQRDDVTPGSTLLAIASGYCLSSADILCKQFDTDGVPAPERIFLKKKSPQTTKRHAKYLPSTERVNSQ